MLARAGVASRRSLLIDVAASALVLLTGVIMAVALPSPDMGALLVLTTLYLCSLAAEAPEVAYANMILAQAIGGAITAQRQIPCESLAWLSSASALALRAAQEQQHGLTGVESIPADWPTTGSLSLRGVSVPRSKSTAGIRGWSLEACARDDFGILGSVFFLPYWLFAVRSSLKQVREPGLASLHLSTRSLRWSRPLAKCSWMAWPNHRLAC
ncbi:hypothetical protein BC828DRAFT_65339 [Blastocladiella britannica]|nr:hypothetical protein BC828DRAFT_65339 [Blastocladiella britannica]